MNRIKTAVLAGVVGFGGGTFLSAPASAGQADPRVASAPVATHTMTYAVRPGTYFAPTARGVGAATAVPARPARDWSTGRDLTLAKPWLTPSR